jgi:HEAT repeat protein
MLREMLHDDNPDVRMRAFRALRQLQGKECIPVAIRLLEDNDANVR